jgi:hypothetical protein
MTISHNYYNKSLNIITFTDENEFCFDTKITIDRKALLEANKHSMHFYEFYSFKKLLKLILKTFITYSKLRIKALDLVSEL